MFGCRGLQVSVVVVVVVVVVCIESVYGTSGWQLSQADAEMILSGQTALRSYLIESLGKLGENIFSFHKVHSMVGRILSVLRTRDLDPVLSFWNGYKTKSNGSAAELIATIAYSLQGCSCQETESVSAWRSFLMTISNVVSMLPPPPDIQLPPLHLYSPDPCKRSFTQLTLLAIHHNRLTLTQPLLAHILYNHRFPNYFPDLETAVAKVIELLGTTKGLLETFRSDPAVTKDPNEILSDVLKFILRQQPSHFHTAMIISELSHSNVDLLRAASTPWEVLHFITEDDYPPDIVAAGQELAAAVRTNRASVEGGRFEGYSPSEMLLAVVSHLAAIPPEDPLSLQVQAVYPHVKLRYLSTRERFFRPRSSSDIAFLLNSFLLLPSGSLVKGIHKIFLNPNLEWQKALDKFEYSKYSAPRALLVDMMRHLLTNSDQLSTCELILFNIFLGNNSQLKHVQKVPVPLNVFQMPEEETPPSLPPPFTDILQQQISSQQSQTPNSHPNTLTTSSTDFPSQPHIAITSLQSPAWAPMSHSLSPGVSSTSSPASDVPQITRAFSPTFAVPSTADSHISKPSSHSTVGRLPTFTATFFSENPSFSLTATTNALPFTSTTPDSLASSHTSDLSFPLYSSSSSPSTPPPTSTQSTPASPSLVASHPQSNSLSPTILFS